MHYQRWKRYGDPLGGEGRWGRRETTHPLAEKLRQLSEGAGLTLDDLTVLRKKGDPYRLDIPSNHRDGKWFRERMEACGLIRSDGYFSRSIHNRGIHYAIFSKGSVRPDTGQPYLNTKDGWDFLEQASKAARWLGYVPFEAISDARNTEPVIRLREPHTGYSDPFVGVSGLDAELLEALEGVDFKASVYTGGSFIAPEQPYRLVFFGEKTSLETVLDPLAELYKADLYMPSGEISDTLLYRMAKAGAEDGREMVVLIFADCDPSGYQMAVSIGHKLRAFSDSLFPELRFRLIAPCLTVEQVKSLGLPSTPLKPTEKRAWREKHGVDQTEIDALATLQPDAFRQIVHEAVAPYFDSTIKGRRDIAFALWYTEANKAFQAALDESGFEEARAEAQERISDLVTELRDIEEELDAMVRKLCPKLPPVEVPQPDLNEPPDPFVSSDMSLADAISILKDRKDYSA